MKLKIKECFLWIDHEQLLNSEVFNLKQGNRSIEKCPKEFHDLRNWNQGKVRLKLLLTIKLDFENGNPTWDGDCTNLTP